MRRPLSCMFVAAQTRMRGLAADESGNVLIYVSVAAAALLGLVGLALDGSRVMITHSEAQAAADAAALAAASQLDRKPDAIVRATTKAGEVVNSQRFATSASAGSAVTIARIKFLSSLPAKDDDPIVETTDPAQAQYVEVTTAQLTHQGTFIRAVSSSSTATIQRTAVAGFREVYCKVPPLMICNPMEDTNPNLDPPPIGVEVQAKIQGGNAAWGPGNYGLLEATCPTSGAGGAACVQEQLATIAPSSCIEKTIDTKPGEAAGPSRKGMNARFGLYENPVSLSVLTAPDINITQNFTPANGAGNCYKTPASPSSATQNVPFPDDSSFNSARVGNGVWNCAAYWAANHGAAAAPPSGCSSTASAPMTRYAAYKLEQTPGNASNYGTSACSIPGVAERRVLYVAVVNCNANPIRGSAANIPVVAFVKAFLLHPVAQGPDAQMDIEVVDLVRPGGVNEVVKDEVQLYR